jgi:hypothetical protein
MKYSLQTFVFTFLIGLLLFACTDLEDLELGEFTAEYAIPLFTSDLSLNDVISNRVENTELSVDTDGQLTLNYEGSLLRRSASDIFNFTAQFLPIDVTDTVFVVTNEQFEIPGSIDIDFLNLKSGDISFQYSSDIPDDITINVEIPQFVKDGQSYTNSFSKMYDGTLPLTGSLIGDNLAGYQIQGGGDTLLTVMYDAILPSGEKIILPSFLVLLTRLEYEYAEGFLGNDIYDIGRDTIEIDFFDNWEQGVINFEDPKIKMTALNSFGFPLDANFFEINVVGIGGERLALVSEAIEDGVGVNFPSINQVGETIRTDFSFNKDNSNLIDILAIGPASVEYELDGEPNPDDNESGRGFMTDSSFIEVQLEVELPLNGYTFGFALRDTFDIDLSNNENVTAAEFKLITESAIPLGLEVEIAFADENFNILETINPNGDNQFIGAAPVDANGVVNGVTIKETIDSFDAPRFARIKNAKKILLRTEFSTTNSSVPQLVKFNANQSVKSRMGLKLEVAN